MAQLFKHLIPFEVLARMPLPFVHRLRDIVRKDKEEAARQYNNSSAAAQNNGGLRMINNATGQTQNFGGFDASAIEELMDELS